MDLTEAGAELLIRARRVLAAIEETRAAVRPGPLAAGLVTMSVSVSFGLAKVAPLLPKLLAKHPKLSIDLRLEDRVVDLLGDGVDLALRVGVAPPDSPFVVARRLATYERVVCAAPALLAKHGPLTAVDALAGVPCVSLGGSPSRWEFQTADGPKTVTVDGRLRTNNILALRDAALAGLGVVQMPRWLVVEDLRRKRLVRILPDASLPTVSVLGVIHADARRTQSLRLVQDFLANELPPSLDARASAQAPR
jgi:DNA-binding transcriptional LysR family regulator